MAQSAEFRAAMLAYDEDRYVQAAQLMEQCAKKGEPVACYLMALWSRNGEGVPASEAQCERWMQELEQLAESDNAEAQWELGQYLRFGDVFPLDTRRANYWLERSALNGWGEAQHHLAWYLQTGQYGYLVDPLAAEEWYHRAFEQGHPETIYTFALREFKNGEITEKAIALLNRAAEKGFHQAAHALRQHRH